MCKHYPSPAWLRNAATAPLGILELLSGQQKLLRDLPVQDQLSASEELEELQARIREYARIPFDRLLRALRERKGSGGYKPERAFRFVLCFNSEASSRVVRRAVQWAATAGADRVRLKHLLLALLEEGTPVGERDPHRFSVLRDHKVNLHTLTTVVLKTLGQVGVRPLDQQEGRDSLPERNT